MHPHDEHDEDGELKELRSLPREVQPPAALEDRTVEALRRRGHLGRGPSALGAPPSALGPQPSARRAWLRAAAVLALAAGAAAAGWVARGPAGATDGGGPRFLLLLYGNATGHTSLEEAVAEYGRWARDLAATGTAVSGERLANEAVVVGAPIDAALVRGYFIVQVQDEDRALEIAATHPHVKRGGTIVVRRIAPT